MPLEDDVREMTNAQLAERYAAAKAELVDASNEDRGRLNDEILAIERELDSRGMPFEP